MRAQEVIRILLRNGFVERKAKGGHRQFVRAAPLPKRLVPSPIIRGTFRNTICGELPRRLVRALMNSAEVNLGKKP